MMRARYAVVAVALFASAAAAEEDYTQWRLHTPTFPSTGGNGVIIGEYNPVISGSTCATDFTATLADGKVYYNSVEFDAVPAQGGILCTNGRWRARDGSASGTTPYRVFFKDGVLRGAPESAFTRACDAPKTAAQQEISRPAQCAGARASSASASARPASARAATGAEPARPE